MPDSGWFEKHVVEALDRLEKKLDGQAAEMTSIRERVAKVEVRALGLASAIAILVTVVVERILK